VIIKRLREGKPKKGRNAQPEASSEPDELTDRLLLRQADR